MWNAARKFGSTVAAVVVLLTTLTGHASAAPEIRLKNILSGCWLKVPFSGAVHAGECDNSAYSRWVLVQLLLIEQLLPGQRNRIRQYVPGTQPGSRFY